MRPSPTRFKFTPWDGKNVIGKLNSNRDIGHDFPLLVILMKSGNSIMARLMAFATTQAQPRDGEVPFIRWAALNGTAFV